jgi:DNA-binding CsgD family transcriptional regulator
MSDGEPDRARSRTLFLLAVATAIGSMGLAAGGTAGTLLGVEITGTEGAAGLPLGLLVAGSAAAALMVSRRTGRVGRVRSLALGYALGAIGAVLAIIAAVAGNFVALLLGSTVLDAGNAAIFLTRYAAAEVGEETTRGRALGAVFFATAIGAVVSGKPPPVSTHYLRKLLVVLVRDSARTAASVGGLPERLSGREHEILQLVAAGKSNGRIASELYVSVGTVKTHLNNIYRKLGARSRTQAVARARELNLL